MTEFTTMEKLQMRVTSYGAVLQHRERVLVTDLGWKGFIAEVYEMVETPEQDCIDAIECRLSLLEKADTFFKDGGSAIAWCMSRK